MAVWFHFDFPRSCLVFKLKESTGHSFILMFNVKYKGAVWSCQHALLDAVSTAIVVAQCSDQASV